MEWVLHEIASHEDKYSKDVLWKYLLHGISIQPYCKGYDLLYHPTIDLGHQPRNPYTDEMMKFFLNEENFEDFLQKKEKFGIDNDELFTVCFEKGDKGLKFCDINMDTNITLFIEYYGKGDLMLYNLTVREVFDIITKAVRNEMSFMNEECTLIPK